MIRSMSPLELPEAPVSSSVAFMSQDALVSARLFTCRYRLQSREATSATYPLLLVCSAPARNAAVQMRSVQ